MEQNIYNKEQINKEEYCKEFKNFIEKSFKELNPGSQFHDSWYIDYLCEIMYEAEQANQQRIIINLPPRHLKSHIITTSFTAWLLGRDSTKRIISASYAQTLSNKLSLDTRMLLRTEWYQEMFPKVQIMRKQDEKRKFMTTNSGFRLATSVGGSIIGEGADVIIVDDPHHPSSIGSKKALSKVNDWFDQVLMTRLNSQKTGVIIVVMQRLHANDLTGHLTGKKNSSWRVYDLPLVHEGDDITYNIRGQIHTRKAGDILNPMLMTHDHIQNLKMEIGEFNFRAQYQQKPLVNHHNIIKQEHLQFVDNMPKDYSHIIQSWDTAAVDSSGADYSACVTMGYRDGKIYIIDIFRTKANYSTLKEVFEKKYYEHKPDLVLVEYSNCGIALVNEMSSKAIPIHTVSPKQDKQTRLYSVSGMFEAKKVIFDRYHPVVAEFTDELLSFPTGKHDDMVDAAVHGLSYFRRIFVETPSIRK